MSSVATRAAGPARMTHGMAAFALALLLGLQPVTTDLYLPALPLLTRALAAPMVQAQLTMSALMLSFGLAQMVCGPLADRIGRRPVLLGGLALYTAASAGCALAGSIEALVAWRVAQGAALAAAVVCARAIVRDLYEPEAGARVMTLAMTGLGIMALVAPPLGGVAVLMLGWRGPLAVVTTIGALTLVFIAWRLPETRVMRVAEATPAGLARTWWRVAADPVFRAWALLVAFSYGGLFTILAASSFIYIEVLGLSPALYGAAMAMHSLSYIAGTFVCRRWIARHGMAGAVMRGGWFTLAGGVGIAVPTLLGVHAVWVVLLPCCLYSFGHGMHQPCAQAGVVAPFPRHAGAASALAGLLLALVAFGIGRWLGTALDGTQRPLAWALAFWSLLCCAVAWTLVPRHAGRRVP